MVIAAILFPAMSFSQVWEITTIDSSTYAFGSPEVVFDHEGSPHLFYYSGEHQEIMHGYLNNGNWIIEGTQIAYNYRDVEFDQFNNARFVTNYPAITMLLQIVWTSNHQVFIDTIYSSVPDLISDAKIDIDSNSYSHILTKIYAYEGIRLVYYWEDEYGWNNRQLSISNEGDGEIAMKLFNNNMAAVLDVHSEFPHLMDYFTNISGYWVNERAFSGNILGSIYFDVDSSDYIHCAFLKNTPSDQKIIVYLNNRSGNWQIEEFFDPEIYPRSATPIAVSINDYISILCFSARTGDLSLIHLFKHLDSDEFSYETVDSGDFTGFKDIKIDAQENIHIIYVDIASPTKLLKYAVRSPLTYINHEIDNMPSAFDLRIYPNPSNTSFTITTNSIVSPYDLIIYNMLGEVVRQYTACTHRTIVWTGTDNKGRPLASGVYLAKVTAGERTITRKLVLQK